MKVLADLVSHSRRSLTGEEIRQRREVAHYRYVHAAPLVPREVFSAIGTRFNYRINGQWRRARCAALAAACLELDALLPVLSPGRARRLVAERFDGLPLGQDEQARPRRLALKQLTLWRAFALWREFPGCSPGVFDWLTANGGRRPKNVNAAKKPLTRSDLARVRGTLA